MTDTSLAIWITVLICIVAAIIVVLILTGILFQAAYKRDIKKLDKNYLWCDRERNRLGLPWSYTKYSLSGDRIFIQRGLLKTTYDEVRLYRVLDLNLSQTLGQKMAKIGTVEIHSSDKTLGCFSLLNIKEPKRIKELISQNVEIQREKHRVYTRESMSDSHLDNDEQDFGHEGIDGYGM